MCDFMDRAHGVLPLLFSSLDSHSQGFVTWGLEVHVPPEIMSKIVSLCLFPKRL